MRARPGLRPAPAAQLDDAARALERERQLPAQRSRRPGPRRPGRPGARGRLDVDHRPVARDLGERRRRAGRGRGAAGAPGRRSRLERGADRAGRRLGRPGRSRRLGEVLDALEPDGARREERHVVVVDDAPVDVTFLAKRPPRASSSVTSPGCVARPRHWTRADAHGGYLHAARRSAALELPKRHQGAGSATAIGGAAGARARRLISRAGIVRGALLGYTTSSSPTTSIIS